MVTVNLQDAKFEDLNIREFSQKAYRAFLPYWNGSEEEFYAYMQKNGIDYDFKVSNISELGEKTDKFLQDLSAAVRRDIGKFDFRLSTALTQRNLKPIETGDYVKITLSSDEELSKDAYNSFLSFNSRSFIDFREFDPDKNELTLIYNRRGIFDENERIAILKARNSLTLSDNFQQAKDNNFILSGLCRELAKTGMDFRYEYTTTEGVTKEYSISADKILGFAEKKEEKKEEAVKERMVREAAKAEIIRENSQTRQSLSEDSSEKEILAEGNTEIRLPVKGGSETNLDEVIEKSISLYEQKEIEKIKIRLAKSREEAMVAYQEMKDRINSGYTIYESINYIKQKFREEHTANMASAFLTKDILEVNLLKNTINSQNSEIQKLGMEVENKNSEITKREETITSLKSTVQTKVNEINLQKEQHQEELAALTAKAEAKFKELDASYGKKVKSLEAEIGEQDELIVRLKSQSELLEKKNSELLEKTYSQNSEIAELKNRLNLEKIQSNDKNRISNDKNAQKNGIITPKPSVSDKQDIGELKRMLDDEKVNNERKREILGELRMDDILGDEESQDEGKNAKRAKK